MILKHETIVGNSFKPNLNWNQNTQTNH